MAAGDSFLTGTPTRTTPTGGSFILKSAEEDMDLTAAYQEVGTYRGAAAMCGRQRCRQCGFQGSLRLFLESAGDPRYL
jgi:hypothetical protein